MALNFYTAKKTINGVEYTAQFSGISAALQAIDNSYIEGTNNTSLEKLSKYLFDNVIVEPKISLNDFGGDKIGETKTKKIGNVEYTVRFDGILTALKAMDVIVTPENLSIDDFGSMEEFIEVVSFAREAMQGWGAIEDFNDVVSFARDVMQGNFRNKTEKPKSTNKKSKK